MTLETAQELEALLEKAEAETSDPQELAEIGTMLLRVGKLIKANRTSKSNSATNQDKLPEHLVKPH
jgi:hypothetical protein